MAAGAPNSNKWMQLRQGSRTRERIKHLDDTMRDSLPNRGNAMEASSTAGQQPHHVTGKKELVEAEHLVSCVMMVRIAGATEGSAPVTRPEQRGASLVAGAKSFGSLNR